MEQVPTFNGWQKRTLNSNAPKQINANTKVYVSYHSDADGVVIRWGYPSKRPEEAYYLISFDLKYLGADRNNPDNYEYGFAVFCSARPDRRFVRQMVPSGKVSSALASKSTTLKKLLLDYIKHQAPQS